MNTDSQLSFSDSLARFIRDLLKMGDLQLQLLSIDLKTVGQSARFGSILAVFSAALLMGSIPVLMFGIAGVLHLAARIPIEYAWLLVGGVVSVIGMILLSVAVTRITRATQAMKRSQEEFHRNVEWVRGVLHQQ